MQIDPRRLLILRAVRRTGSVQAAAVALHLTPSGVSQHLSRLQSETGLQLLDHTNRGGGRPVRLTSAGITLAEHADTLAQVLADTEREAEHLQTGTQGAVRIGGFGTMLGQLLVPVLIDLAVSDPALQVQIIELDTPEGISRLRAGTLDLLLADGTNSPPVHPGLVGYDIRQDHYRIVVPNLWPAGTTLTQLLAGAWITSPADQPSRRILDRLCSQHHVDTGVLHICTESRTMLSLVAAGIGAAIVPELTLAHQPTAGIRVYPTTDQVGSRTLTILSTDQPSPATVRVRTLLL